jgi:hypothetical protein
MKKLIGYMVAGFALVQSIYLFITFENQKKYSPLLDEVPESTSNISGDNFHKRFDIPMGTGLQVLSPELADFRPSSEPLTMVIQKNGKAALADKDGKIVLKTNYDWIGKFHDGLALVKIEGDEEYGGSRPNSWGYIDKKGKVVIPVRFRDAYPFSEGLAPFRGANEMFGYINPEGKVVIQPQYEEINEFSDGQAQIKKNKVWFWINKEGKKVQ